MKIPWLKILTSPTVLCIYLAQFCSAWGGYTTLTSLPQYMEDVLKINIKQVFEFFIFANMQNIKSQTYLLVSSAVQGTYSLTLLFLEK